MVCRCRRLEMTFTAIVQFLAVIGRAETGSVNGPFDAPKSPSAYLERNSSFCDDVPPNGGTKKPATKNKMLLVRYSREEDFLAGIDIHVASVPGRGQDKGKFHAFPSDFLLSKTRQRGISPRPRHYAKSRHFIARSLFKAYKIFRRNRTFLAFFTNINCTIDGLVT